MNVIRTAATPGAGPPGRGDAEPGAGLFDNPLDTDAGADQDAALLPDAESGTDAFAASPGAIAAAEVTEGQLIAWIDGIVDRDERALTALYDATLSRVYGVVLRIVRRPAVAAEVVEDTYFQVWRLGVRFDVARGRAWPWLLGMARSRAIDAVRREARHQHDSLDSVSVPETADGAPPSDDLLDAARGHANLHRALMLLNAQPRQLVALAFFRGLSHEEIACQTALPLGTVKSQIRRALVTLRQQLGETGFHA
ncbi:MAG: sigma-70 family RNA polymerase sigma factor [Burkholderiaceae bacterium]|jgi:RNA polymerase sigma-70 factor (ECF subfamily)|nr:sigma-70 family RNA polymerase sigma factor [Burkholderiaceae bacterium]